MKRTPVSNLSCERTVYGYILRKNQQSKRMAVLLTLIPISILAVLALLLEPEVRILYLLYVAGCAVIQLVFLTPLLLLSKGQRLELDRGGVHLRFDHRKGKDLRWEDIRDWGLGYTVTKYGKHYFLYFSPEKLKALGTDNKKFFGVKGILTASIIRQDYLELSRSGLLTFCREHLGDSDGADRYVPMFLSDITEGLYGD